MFGVTIMRDQQVNLELGAVIRFARDVDCAAMSGNYSIHHRKADARSVRTNVRKPDAKTGSQSAISSSA